MSQNVEFGAKFKLNTDEAKVAQERLAALKNESLVLANGLTKDEVSVATFAKRMREINTESRSLEQALRALSEAARTEGEVAETAATKTAAMGKATADATEKTLGQARQGFVDLSRALQDFVQGGFGGILNNLEGIGRAIPALLKNPLALLSSIPAILTTVGTALYIFGPKVYNAFRGFVFGSNEIPKATDALGRIDGRLKEVGKRLDEYREAQRLTNSELADYNKLSAEQVVLERQKTEEIKKQADAQKLRDLKAPGAEEAQKERAEIVQGAVGGKQKEIEGALGAQLAGQDQQTMFGDRRILEGQIATSSPGVNRNALEKQLRALNDRIRRSLRGELAAQYQKQAEAMLAAAAQGDQGQINRVAGLMNGNERFATGEPLENVRQQFEQATPRGMKARRDEEHAIAQQEHDAKLNKDLKAKNEREAKEQTKAALDPILKSGQLDKDAEALAAQARGKQLEPEAAYDFIREGIEKAIGASLKAKGVANADRDSIEAAAGQIARKGMTAAEHTRTKDEQRQTKQQHDDEQQRKEAEAKQKTDSKDLETGLGNDFLAEAEHSQLAISTGRMTKEQRSSRQAEFNARLQEQVYRKLLASGMDPGRAAELANGAQGFVRQDINRQMNQMQAMQGGTSRQTAQQLMGVFAQNMQRQPQAQGRKKAENQGGLQSVAPTAPPAAAGPAPQTQLAAQTVATTAQAVGLMRSFNGEITTHQHALLQLQREISEMRRSTRQRTQLKR